MTELDSVIAGLQITVLMLGASAMVLLHIKMYRDWQQEKLWEAERDALFKELREAAKHEARADR